MLDDIDRKILSEYLKDGRLSYREIASRIGVAVGTVLSRTKKMEKEGVIKGYSAILDQEKLGYELTVITEVTVSKGKLLEMEREIAKLANICAVYDITGLTDAIIIAKFHNREDLSRFTKSILRMPFVERTNTHLVLTTIKEDFRLV
ncbi:MAG: Lrp/AsnC family transcriptional regulator [Candidatus Methylarchaceae archaeon HK01B]|nr:Lrp/AsnC family transcriptional regulator [Candidatus Methylarchaceae archaeon HK01M]MCP8312092.1 Lrp/AsnC family transcriptional regulator [Candidatus Methylarchaceae archaeon HK02M1]MCP8318784.1 Lrp/AsnC family transcriptional regulator [Candidatus Methylarchaceae archaeon HK01B]